MDRSRRWRARIHGSIGQWSLEVRGDVGGFGVGSDLAFQAFAAFWYAVGERGTLGIGNRHLDIDFDDGGLELDAAFSRRILGFRWGTWEAETAYLLDVHLAGFGACDGVKTPS